MPPPDAPVPPPNPGAPPRKPTIPPPLKPDPLRVSIDAIRKHAAQLNELTDQAARTVQAVETFLNEECSVGVTSCVQVNYVSEESPAGTYLAYRRVGPKFRIAIVEADGHAEDVAVKAWSDAPREEKLETFAKLPELLMKIAKNVQELFQQTQNSIKQVEENLRALTGK